ncbi:endo-alpha-N-acetylgalactosaminidase family protein [uncultured Pseudoflavonifractor sp.]|uniref:endo-alpha-N-acetylgalactosaminidase family protein n=1 Tax=uncultured Pseudoflavonifractor sp. TaxID=1221379 RepID=UPI0025F4DD2E|nr:endo-alpha-N-acetylgalactosaminidase family protein [uncultured Pseudoflavonifractor sp.]
MASFKTKTQKAIALLLCLGMLGGMIPAGAADTALPTDEGDAPAISLTAEREGQRIEDSDDAVVWSGDDWGTWTYDDESGATSHFGNTVGSTVTVTFTGTGIAVYGKKAYNGPIMTAVVDDGEAADVDFYGNGDNGYDQLLYEVTGLENVEHTLVMTFTERTNESAYKPQGGAFQAEINYFMVSDETSVEPGPTEPVDPDVGVADGAIHDIWSQDPATVKGTGAICEIKDGERHLKADATNGNATAAASYPAVFIDETMSAALKGVGADGTAFLEVTFKPTVADTRLGLYLNYENPGKGFFVGADATGWFWQTYDGGSNAWYQGSRVAAPGVGTEATLRLEWTGSSLTKATVNGKDLFQNMPVDFSSVVVSEENQGRVGFKAGVYGSSITEYMLSDIHYTGQAKVEGRSVSGTVTDGEKPVANAVVTLNGKQDVTNGSGEFTITDLTTGTYTMTVAADGYEDASQQVEISDADVTGLNVVLTALKIETATLSTEAMDVVVDTAFPRVIQYNMKGANDGKTFYGQVTQLDTLKINGVSVKPVVTAQTEGSKITYTMTVQDEGNNIDAVITAEMVAQGNTLAFNITDLTYGEKADKVNHPVESIEIPNHSLISVRSTQAGAELAAARLGSSTIQSGDTFVTVDGDLNVNSVNNQGYMYAFLSNSELSAGISSNSDAGSSAAGSNNYRLTVTAQDRGTYKTVGVGSSLWYLDRKISSSDATQASYANLTDEEKVVGIRAGIDEMPYVKVVITGDENSDETVDWQDAAIAARDQEIIHIPAYSDSVRDLVTTRISMNFQSEAPNPFLTALDNVKRVALNSDGLGQSVLLKGYANEGHDSGHPDYYDIGRRIGGVEDMLTMLTEGHKYGAEFGIHVNASEFYPEAKAFNEDMVKRNGQLLSYGWNWLDQGIGINGVYDLASGNRNERFDKLYELVGNNLDYVYVDVWGNNTSGTEDAWQTRKLSNEITSNEWRIVHEWGYANEWDSTFQHWVTDFTYGGYDQKGKLNSEIMRFMLNSYKDSFPPDFPTYGGASNAPLLGGPVMQGFEGWQGDVEYDLFIDNLYNQMLPTKFLQHYDIMKWVDNDEAVSIPYGTSSGGFSENQRSQWTPEVQITLQSEDRTDTVVVTRGSDSEINDTYSYDTPANKLEYRSRTITLNGKEILRGASDPGDFTSNAPAGNLQYLIPWYWDENGDVVSAENEKLYHYNLVDGESTWDLPDGWTDLANVKVYELTDQGRTNETVVEVKDGRITLTAKAGVPYVVVKGDKGAPAPDVTYTAAGMHLTDVSFNGVLTDSWTVTGAAERAVTSHLTPMLKMSGEATVSQKITDLVAGQKYAVYVGVDNRSDAKASITITCGDEVLASNYTLRSIARNYISSYIHHNGNPTESGSSYFQNMYVFFTAPESGDVVLTLSREAGEGNTYFDDVRVVANESDLYTYDEEGNIVAFYQDFENEAQGLFPFVMSGAQGIADGRNHLSELHAPYTQAGWDVKKMDDVLDGNWSVKINGLVGYNNAIYYTIPQNFHFEPGVTYNVSFKYQMGSEGTYEVVYGSGAYNNSTATAVPLKMSLGETATCTFTIIGDESGQTWFGIRSTGKGANTQGTSGAAADFGGYKDFVLDDLSITVSEVSKGDLSQLVTEGSAMLEGDYTGDWAAFQAALSAAKDVLNNPEATQEAVTQAATELERTMLNLTRLVTKLTGVVADAEGNPVAGATVTLENSGYRPTGATCVTDAQGRYEFDWLSAERYMVKVTAQGYDVITVDAGTLTAGETNQKDVTLATKTGSGYVNTFDSGDVSMIQPLAGNAGDGANEVIEAVDYNGSKALKVTFKSTERNSVVDQTLSMKNGTVEMDVTPLTTGSRFGVTLRGNGMNSRIFIGTFDSANGWGWEYFGSGNLWSSTVQGPGLYVGVTTHIKVTLKDNNISLWVDGVQLMDEVAMSNPPSEAGYVGINMGRNADAAFIIDNLSITPADEAAEDTAPISGQILNSANEPVVGAQITVTEKNTRASDVVTSTVTGGDGRFTTVPLAAGDYVLTVTAAGYDTITMEATVAGGEAVALEAAKLAVDDSVLQSLYDQHKNDAQGSYTDQSWKAFQDALAQAEEALKSGDDQALLAAYEALETAINSLTIADKTELYALYDECAAMANSGYSDSSWLAFRRALSDAVDVLLDGSATQTQVDEAFNALKIARDGLSDESSSVMQYNIVATAGEGGTISPRGSVWVPMNTSRTFTITANEGYVISDVLVDGKSVGAVSSYTFEKVNGRHTIEAKFAPAGEESEETFTDVDMDAWYGKAVAYVTDNGIMNGTSATTFAPGMNLTRSMMAQILYNMEKQPTVTGSNPFNDVPAGQWYTDAVVWAAANDIVNGYNGSFQPDDSITREQMAAILYRYAQYKGEDTSAAGSLESFSDGSATSGWAKEAMAWAVGAGVIGGKGNGVLDPTGTATRAEVAQIMMNFLETK